MFTTKAAHWGVRSGSLVVNGKEIPTPNYVISSTRGAIEHLTPDHAPSPPVCGIYAEEFIDRQGLVESALSSKSLLPIESKLILGSCRRPGSRRIANKPNSIDDMAIDTHQGSKLESLKTMTDFMCYLKPDLFLVPSDDPAQSSNSKVGTNRLRKMHTRSMEWFDRFLTKRLEMGINSSNLFFVARIPPELRTPDYLAEINTKCDAYCFAKSQVSSSNEIPHDLVDARKLRVGDLPNSTWREVLDQLAEGTDLVYVPLTSFTDAGQALQLSWPANENAKPYWDLNDPKYTTDMTKLGNTGHSLAYIHHLLDAGEMTANVLLQLHNISVVESLFESIRDSIERGTFEADREQFLSSYGL